MRPHAVVTAQGPRPSHQDRAWTDGATRLIVADGMGGHESGEVAAQTALDYAQRATFAEIRDGVVTAVEVAAGRNAGTTLSVAMLDRRELSWLHAGDSALWLVTGKGRTAQIRRLTADQSRWGNERAREPDSPKRPSRECKSILVSCVMAPSFRHGIGPVTWDTGSVTLPAGNAWLFGTTDGFHEAFEDESGDVDHARLLAGLRDVVRCSVAHAQVYVDGCAQQTHDNATVAWWRL